VEGCKDERETVALRAEDGGRGEPDGRGGVLAPPTEGPVVSRRLDGPLLASGQLDGPLLASGKLDGPLLANARRADGTLVTSERRPEGPRRYYAALDLGTNNCRLLVAQPTRRGFKVKTSFSRIIRLGEGLSKSGRLSNDAIERTLEALQICAGKMRSFSVARAGMIATEACRSAANGPEFLCRARKETGLDIKVISRETEARLAVAGCASLLDADSELALVFDIGGGSSELIWLDLTRSRQRWGRSLPERLEAQNCIAAWTSLPVGVVTLAERFGSRSVDHRTFEAMVAHVTNLLAPFEAKHALRQRMRGCSAHMLGTSGTVTTLAGVHLGLPRYDRSRVDGCWLGARQARSVIADLLSRSFTERAAQPCIGPTLAEFVLGGCAILEAMLRTWPCERLRVADRGLREGILATLMAEDDVYRGERRHGSRRC
jgi:exopolyphosphatase / guanosine-5'-triphosphate,3'-diphosphate pyrophosphatase